MAANFNQIFATRADTIEAPKTPPIGKYHGTVKGFDTGESTKTKSPYVEVTFLLDQALDVAPEHQEEANLALAKGPVEMSVSFYLTAKAMYRLVDFLEKDLGIPRPGRTLGEMLEQCIGLSCAVILDTETSRTTGKEFISIKRTAPL